MEMSLDSLPQLLQFNHHFFPIILSALLFFVVTVCFFMYSSSWFPKMKLPPGPKPLPVLGNMHKLVIAQLHVVLRDFAKTYGPINQLLRVPLHVVPRDFAKTYWPLYQLLWVPLHVVLHDFSKTYGPICHLKVGQVSVILVTSSEAAKDILKTQELKFAQRPKLKVLEMTSLDHGTISISPYGEYWRQTRKIFMMEFFSPGRVRHFRSLREQEVSNLIESVKGTFGLPVNVSEMIFACGNNMILKLTFGQKCERQDDILTAVEEQFRLSGQFSLPEAFPFLQLWYHLNGTRAKLSHFRELYDDVLGRIIVDRRIGAKSPDHSSRYRENMVDSLLKLQESAGTGIPLTDNTMKDIILDMLGGGINSSPTAVEWAMSELLKNPDVMKKAQTELRDELKGKAVVEEADLKNIQYLKLIIKETFRLHPPVPLFPRVAREACVVQGYDIPKDSIVLISNWTMGRDPNRWENPEKFEPERFLSTSIDLVGNHFEFLPFGSGRRMCAGMGSVLASTELMLANLIYCFDWKLANGVAPDELDMAETSGLAAQRLNPLFVVATPHQAAA